MKGGRDSVGLIEDFLKREVEIFKTASCEHRTWLIENKEKFVQEARGRIKDLDGEDQAKPADALESFELLVFENNPDRELMNFLRSHRGFIDKYSDSAPTFQNYKRARDTILKLLENPILFAVSSFEIPDGSAVTHDDLTQMSQLEGLHFVEVSEDSYAGFMTSVSLFIKKNIGAFLNAEKARLRAEKSRRKENPELAKLVLEGRQRRELPEDELTRIKLLLQRKNHKGVRTFFLRLDISYCTEGLMSLVVDGLSLLTPDEFSALRSIYFNPALEVEYMPYKEAAHCLELSVSQVLNLVGSAFIFLREFLKQSGSAEKTG